MKKSFVDRIFPQSQGPVSSQHGHSDFLARRSSQSPTSTPRIRMHDSIPLSISSTLERTTPLLSGSIASQSSTSRQDGLHSAPLSASVLHHNDPFLPVERAARALQDTIQSLLDVQSQALGGGTNGVELDDVASRGSLTPTQSVVTPKSSSGMRTVPIRQPVRKKIGLQSARKGLARKMREFAELREEELRVLDVQITARTHAISRINDLEAKKQTCKEEIESIRQEDTSTTVSNLRSEAKSVQSEIEELEHKLLELRVRHRHLLNQANQLESTLESKVSSFQGTITMIDREAREFLRRPPVPHALANGSASVTTGIYALKPDRRTLDMAKEQWSSEQDLLSQHKLEVEGEHIALQEGERIWSEAVNLIDGFERSLRERTARLSDRTGGNLEDSIDSVISDLDKLIESLGSDLALAESKSWNLLICALGAELEALHQAHEMLTETQQIANSGPGESANEDLATILDTTSSRNTVPDHKLSSPHGSEGSNQSLEDTLDQFPGNAKVNTTSAGSSGTVKYESEDDEPPADFLLSR